MENEEAKSDQTKEIEEALKAEVVEPAEWGRWEDDIQAKVDSLINGKKMDRLAIFCIAGLGVAAIGATAMLGKVVNQLANGLNQLGQNQQYIAERLGLIERPTVAEPIPNVSGNVNVEENGMVDDSEILDAKTFDLPNDSKVAPPHMGPATEATEEAKRQLEQDKKAGIIDEFKGAEPDASS